MRCGIGSALVCMLMATIAPAQEKTAMPEGAVVRLGVHRLRVPAAILSAAFTPDQRTFVVVYREENAPNVLLFDVATGLLRKRLDIRNAHHVGMARHKPLMVVDTKKGFEVWDVAAEKRVQQLPYPEAVYYRDALAISPDGTQVAAADRHDNKAYYRGLFTPAAKSY